MIRVNHLLKNQAMMYNPSQWRHQMVNQSFTTGNDHLIIKRILTKKKKRGVRDRFSEGETE